MYSNYTTAAEKLSINFIYSGRGRFLLGIEKKVVLFYKNIAFLHIKCSIYYPNLILLPGYTLLYPGIVPLR
ncbi:hypothetical protein AS034_13480 [[Bacillus] enclensis]|nr:hypothetical protein AS034_13480 [[Bacillus] enclensis]